MSIRNTELQSESKMVTKETAELTLGGQVPAGMKRWVSFLTIDTATVNRASDVGVYFASVGVSNPTRASIIATSNRKRFIPMEGTKLSRSNKARPLMLPESGPNPENPLFSIAAGNWLGVFATAATANVFMQHFDE
jgi:hypothetical protein